MRHLGLALLLALLLPAAAAAQPMAPDPVPVWQQISGKGAPAVPGTSASVKTRGGASFALDHAGQREVLADTPSEGAGRGRVVLIPTPKGTLERFRAVETPVLAPALARRFPKIRTYAAEGIDDPSASARLDLTPLGFHASVESDGGFWYVDPRYRDDKSVYAAYYREDLVDRRGPVEEPEEAAEEYAAPDEPAQRAPGDAVVLRTYRLALANDPNYATYFGGTDVNVEAAKATLVNRINQVYNDDLAIRMQLVGNDNLLNFDTASEFNAQYSGVTASCNASPNGGFLTRNDTVLDNLIGSANYDIGHFVGGGGGFNGGGVAYRPSVGQSNKGGGCTGLNPPVGDGFAIDYVAHEMGHQFGANHTYNGTGDSNCSANRAASAAVEPGSGVTIMGYAGICSVDNLQAHSDPYFSQRSQTEILAYVNGVSGAGGSPATTTNHSPVVNAGLDRTIPVQTPFTLTGNATDADSDGLVYLWEQNDSAATGNALLSNAKLNGPLFRVFGTAASVTSANGQLSPSPGENIATASDRVRSFPDAAQVAADDTNAETAGCPASDVTCFSEFLPTTARTLNFRLTARDRRTGGGGSSYDDVAVGVAGTTPFAVTAPAGPAGLTGNASASVTWNVAGTTAAPFSVSDVRISFSTDGGLTFPYEVLASTANDGAETVTVPNLATTQGRFKVEAIDNYFYDVSDGNLTVALGPGATPTVSPTVTPTVTAAPTVTPTATTTTTPAATTTTTPAATTTTTPPATTTTTETTTPTPTRTATTTPAATAAPAVTFAPSTFTAPATLAPDLALVPRRTRAGGSGRVSLPIGCKAVTAGTPPAACTGRAKLTYVRGGGTRKAGSARFSFATSQVGSVAVKLRRSVRNRLAGHAVRATLKVVVGSQTATRPVKLKRTG